MINLSWVVLVVFIILKLVDVITWSWGWVLSPLWIIILIAILCGTFSNSSWED